MGWVVVAVDRSGSREEDMEIRAYLSATFALEGAGVGSVNTMVNQVKQTPLELLEVDMAIVGD